MADRLEVWEFGEGAIYQEVVMIENGKALVPENVIEMLLRGAGYKKVQTFIYE